MDMFVKGLPSGTKQEAIGRERLPAYAICPPSGLVKNKYSGFREIAADSRRGSIDNHSLARNRDSKAGDSKAKKPSCPALVSAR